MACSREGKRYLKLLNEEVIMAATSIATRKIIAGRNSGLLNGYREKIVEGFWFSVCLLLFIVLGPFSAPIVLAFLFFNNHLNSDMQEPESLLN
jgi:hypothetical protein